MEERTWQLIEQGMKDIQQWINDAPTPEIKAQREQEAARILLSNEKKIDRAGGDNQIVAGNWTPHVSLPELDKHS
jgi:hypothetical protein